MERNKRFVTGSLVVVFAMALTLPSIAHARIIYVDANATGLDDGSSWTNACRYLQDALADANTLAKPVEVRVGQGTYKPDRDHAFPSGTGDREATFHLINGVTLRGGFAGIGAADPNVNDPNIYRTILSGDLRDNDIEVNRPSDMIGQPSRAENSRHVVTADCAEPNAVLEGFTVRGGNAEPPLDAHGVPLPANSGGGLLCAIGSPTLVRCTFIANTAGNGGGVHCQMGSPKLLACVFRRNAARVICYMFADDAIGFRYGEGGGMCAGTGHGEPLLEDCTFEENFAYYGGGMSSKCNTPTLKRCVFVRNVCPAGDFFDPLTQNPADLAGGQGGGMVHGNGRARLSECVFEKNSADDGGGVYLSGSLKSVLEACVFRGNSAEWSGGAVQGCDYSDFDLVNCVMTGNQAGNTGGAVRIWYYGTVRGLCCVFSGNRAWHGGALDIELNVGTRFENCTMVANSADVGSAVTCHARPKENAEALQLTNCILWNPGAEIDSSGKSAIEITYSDVEGGWVGEGNIDIDPLFADPGSWDANGTPDRRDDVWTEGDYHLKSQAGRWDPNSQSWATDAVTGPCIDAGDPNSPVGDEPEPNGGRINMGAYGGTAEASKSYVGPPAGKLE